MFDLYGTATADADALIEGAALQQSHELSRDNRLRDSLTSRRTINPLPQKANYCSTGTIQGELPGNLWRGIG
jgi:hypothetical protein